MRRRHGLDRVKHALVPNPKPTLEFLSEDVAFVEEQDDMCLHEQRMRHNGLEKLDGVMNPIDVVFLAEKLVKGGDRSDEYDGICIFEVRHPCLPLIPRVKVSSWYAASTKEESYL